MWHLTRRTLLAGAAVLAGDAALAQSAPPARVKGPLVWLDLDQKELDDAYDQSVYAPNQRQITGRYVTNSEAVRARIGAPKRLAYGSTPIEGLDLYAAKTPNAPVQVFIHGGAWRAGLAKDYATPAEMFVDAGAHFAVARLQQCHRDQRRPHADGASRCAVPSHGSARTRRASAATRTASTSPVTPPAVISRAWSSPPTGARTSACRAMR